MGLALPSSCCQAAFITSSLILGQLGTSLGGPLNSTLQSYVPLATWRHRGLGSSHSTLKGGGRKGTPRSTWPQRLCCFQITVPGRVPGHSVPSLLFSQTVSYWSPHSLTRLSWRRFQSLYQTRPGDVQYMTDALVGRASHLPISCHPHLLLLVPKPTKMAGYVSVSWGQAA